MCIMEVRAGQRSSTIAQACAHNIRTVIDDGEMFCTLLESRGEHERVRGVRASMANLNQAYADTLELFGEFAAEEEATHGRHHDHDDGTNERADVGRISHTHGDERPDEGSLIETAHHDAGLARRFETR
jgi:hypothetical protein